MLPTRIARRDFRDGLAREGGPTTAKRRPRAQLRKNRDRGRPGVVRPSLGRRGGAERPRGRRLLEDEDHASGERVLPPGARERSEQARSRYDLPKHLAADAKDLLAGDVVAFRGLITDVRLSGKDAPEDAPEGALEDAAVETVRCTVRGRLETADSEDRTLFAVGDRVELSRLDDGTGVIHRLLPRRNFIVRGDRRVRRFRHVIAANIDGVVLVTSALEPRFRPGIVDRFLVAASSQEVPASLVINKMDLVEPNETPKAAKRCAEIEEFRTLYERLGVRVLPTSAVRREGTDALVQRLSTGRLVLVGHSGVGKSTLLNALSPALDLDVRPVNRKTGKGTHTTAVARLFELRDGIEVIDTPGIRELDIVDVASVDLEAHFPEFLPLLERCEMDNCEHRTEPGCAVTSAVEAGEVHPRRYESYLTLRAEIEKQEQAYG